MKKIAVLGVLFLVIFSRTFADENTNKPENIYFSWQYYRYINENNKKTSVSEDLNQSINLSNNQLMNLNSLQNTVASFIGLSILTGVIIDYSINWREYRIRNQRERIRREIWGDIWDQQMEIQREREFIERGFHSSFYYDPDRIMF